MWIHSKLFSVDSLTLASFKLARKVSSGNGFKQENQKPWTPLNPGLVLIGFKQPDPSY